MPDVWDNLVPKGAKVRIVTRDGERDLAVTDQPEDARAVLGLLVEVLKRDAASKSDIQSCVEAIKGLTGELRANREAIERLAQSHADAQIAHATELKRLAEQITRPSVPVYDKSGKLIGVRRVETL